MKNSLLIAFLSIWFWSTAQDIEGLVVDAETKSSIGFANISLVDYNAVVQADENGKFSIKGRFPLPVNLRVVATGYEMITAVYNGEVAFKLELQPIHFDFDEVNVTASGNEMKRKNVSFVELKSIKELNEVPQLSLGQMLETVPGVYNASTGPGISKPVIRGLQGVRVLTLLNGVRMEGQQWGGDHGLGISELGIGTVEVMKGPASLLYGADALGGVLYLSNELYGYQGEHRIELGSHFESATLGLVNHLLYKGATKNLKFIVGGRLASHADYQIPDKQFVKNSRFQDQNLKFAMGWHRGIWVGNVRYDYSRSTIGIPGHSHDSLPSVADFVSSNQLRKKTLPVQYLNNHIASWENKLVLKKHTFQLLTSFTLNQLLEHEDKVTIPELFLNTYNVPYKLNVESRLRNNFVLNYGVQGMYLSQINSSMAEGRLVPNAQQTDNGLYFVTNWAKNKWRVQAGARGDVRTISSKADGKFLEPFNKTYAGLNFSLGSSYELSKNHLLRLNATSGFRIPHLSELLSNGVHHGTFRYEIGSVELTTEKAIQVDLSYEFTGEHLSLVVNPFLNQIVDFIYLEPQDYLLEGMRVYKYNQTKGGVTQFGGDVAVHWHPHFAHILHYESSFSYLYMHAKEQNAYSFIPQPRWSNAIIARFSMKSKVKIDNVVLQYQYYLPQNTVAQYETPSVDYGLLDLGMQVSLAGKLPIKLQLGVKNLTNTSYINHLSRLKNIGLHSIGRSFYVKLLMDLKIK